LLPEDYDSWLGSKTAPEDLRTLLRPYDESLMEAYAVSRKVNNVKNDTEECIEPINDDQG
jgi:putative SOS response-associated peptidase YedK